jgi:very-short-patch-repair endonuclease
MIASGLSHKQVHTFAHKGVLERHSHGLYRMPGSTPTFKQALMAACLRAGPGALGSHRAAARSWKIEGFEQEFIEITAPHLVRMDGVVIHRSRELGSGIRTVRDGIPITNPTRTVVDLAGIVPVAKLEVAVDTLVSRRLISLDRVEAYLDEYGHGRRGVKNLRKVLGSYGIGTGDSGLETLLRRTIRQARLPEPVFQHRVYDEVGYIGRLDAAWPDRRLGVEADSFKYHGERRRWKRDLARRNRLVGAGWRLIHLTKEDLTRNRSRTVALLQRELVTQPMFVA